MARLFKSWGWWMGQWPDYLGHGAKHVHKLKLCKESILLVDLSKFLTKDRTEYNILLKEGGEGVNRSSLGEPSLSKIPPLSITLPQLF